MSQLKGGRGGEGRGGEGRGGEGRGGERRERETEGRREGECFLFEFMQYRPPVAQCCHGSWVVWAAVM